MSGLMRCQTRLRVEEVLFTLAAMKHGFSQMTASLSMASALLTGCCCEAAETPTDLGTAAQDPYLWLENVTGERALAWVKEQDAISTKSLEASPEFEPIRQRLLSILPNQARSQAPSPVRDPE